MYFQGKQPSHCQLFLSSHSGSFLNPIALYRVLAILSAVGLNENIVAIMEGKAQLRFIKALLVIILFMPWFPLTLNYKGV